jgi:hypothetical protein
MSLVNTDCNPYGLLLFFSLIYSSRKREWFSPYTRCTVSLGAEAKYAKTIAIQRRIDNLGERYYDGLINVREYVDGLSLIVAKPKEWHL